MDTLFGLPAHPLLVHIPIVLLPLAAVGVLVMAIRPRWHARYRWVVLAFGAAGALGAVLGASAGEELERRIIAVEGADAASSWEHHAELGDTARLFALIFFVVLAVFVLVPWWLERRDARAVDTVDVGGSATAQHATANTRWIRVAVALLAVAGAIGSVTTVIQAGHSGSRSVWEDYMHTTGGGG